MKPLLRRWPVVLACTVAAAVPLSITASGTGTPVAQAATRQATPVIDPDFLYAQLYDMAKAYSYRISGADGDPRNPADPFNLPPTVNGWQELVAHWKSMLTACKRQALAPSPP